MALDYPTEFPPSLFIQAGQRLLPISGKDNEPLRQEVVAAVLCHLVSAVIKEQIQDAGDHAAAINLAVAALKRFGAYPFDLNAVGSAGADAGADTNADPGAAAVCVDSLHALPTQCT
jgi:hypothetical protein